MRKKSVPICPRCGSTNLKSIYLASPAELSLPGAKKLGEQISKHPFGAPIIGWQPQNLSVYICKDCDYNGICPAIDIEKIGTFKKQLKKKK